MSNIVLFRQDPFETGSEKVASLYRQKDARGVRRPLYGYVPKPDRFASLSLRQSGKDGDLTPVSMPDHSGPAVEGQDGVKGYSNANHNFFITNVQHAAEEKMQVVETFGQDFVFFFGQRPMVLQVQGMLMNTSDFPWKQEWLSNYEHYLRGTRCVQNRTRVFLHVDDQLYSGYVFGTSITDDANLPHVCPFSFRMLVFNQVDLGASVVRTFQDTRLVGETLYVDYIEAPLETEQLYLIDPRTGEVEKVSSEGGAQVVPIEGALERVRTWFYDFGFEEMIRNFRRQIAIDRARYAEGVPGVVFRSP